MNKEDENASLQNLAPGMYILTEGYLFILFHPRQCLYRKEDDCIISMDIYRFPPFNELSQNTNLK